jgi:sugar lactone lactonase YvrE
MVRYFAIVAATLLPSLVGCQMTNDDAPRARTPRAPDVDDAQLATSTSAPERVVGRIEPVALFRGPMPTGVAVSREGRLFVNFPRWGDPVEFTVAEVRDGKAVPYPNAAINKLETNDQANSLVSVLSVVIDGHDRLWILDTGSINFQPVKPGGPKLLCVDLKTNEVVKRIPFPDNVARSTSYLNDVRFDLGRGKEGMAFITDSSDGGPNGIIVVDLATGESWRKLHDHPSTKADGNFVPTVEGRPLLAREPNQPEAFVRIGSDGIAIDPKSKLLYYCPLASHRLHSVSLDALADRDMSDDQVAQTAQDLGPREFASDGMECDNQGRLYLTDYEHNAIRRRNTDGRYEIIAQDARMIWPDSLAISADGWLYFTANQLNRQPRFHNGNDLRQPPYAVFRTRIGAQPMAMR